MKLPEFPELQFDSEKHQYILNKPELSLNLPAVSTIMRFLSREVYGQIDPYILEKAAARGTAVHDAIESINKYGWSEHESDIEGYMLAYEKWRNQMNPKHIASEFRVYHKSLLYAGTIDEICTFDDTPPGMVDLTDYKTSTSLFPLLAYIQLSAYSEALRSFGIAVNKAYVLHLKDGAEFEFIQVPDLRKQFLLFQMCAGLHAATLKMKG